jgi:biotin carboxyl carrier protein
MKLTARAGEREHEVLIERRDALFVVTVDGVASQADVRELAGGFLSIVMNGRSYEVSVEAEGDTYRVRHGASRQTVTLTDPSRKAREAGLGASKGPQEVVTLMPGKVARVLVQVGDQVQPGQGLVVVEAMKMENEIGSPKAGKVVAIHVEPGRNVEGGASLVVVE